MSLKDTFRSEVQKAVSNGYRGKKAVAVAVGAMGAMSVGNVMAALPTGIDTQLATVQADGLALADLVWPVVITLFGALVLFKLFKRFGSQI